VALSTSQRSDRARTFDVDGSHVPMLSNSKLTLDSIRQAAESLLSLDRVRGRLEVGTYLRRANAPQVALET
jgi:hypothetical protein